MGSYERRPSMSDYTELVKALRCKSLSKQCDSCKYGYHLCPDSECNDACHVEQIYADAAAAIEALLSFAHYVADKVTMSDEDWEEYHEAFTEIACRKLVKLGVISVEDDRYVYRRNEPPQVDA